MNERASGAIAWLISLQPVNSASSFQWRGLGSIFPMASDDHDVAFGLARCSQNKHRRKWGFWIFLLSNLLWSIWGWHDHAYALVALQVGLAVLNVRGVSKNEPH